MYYEHFGLKYPPFKITPDTQLFFAGGNRGLVLDALLYAIQSGEGIVKVVGEVGSGKTMLCRMLQEKLLQHVEIVYLLNPRLSPDKILHAVALELQLPITPQTDRLEVMQRLQSTLLEKHAANKQVVVFIEEAQEMPLETLEEIRLLSNLETSRSKLLQIVLFGQPELDHNLAVLHIRQLRERITHSFYLSPLSRKEISEYIYFRMQAVGYRGPPVFTPEAVRLITKVSNGLLRRVNILADKSLLAAFASNMHQVTAKHVTLAAKDSGFYCRYLSAKLRWSLWIGALLGSFTLAGWWYYPVLLENLKQSLNVPVVSTVAPPAINTPPSNEQLLQQRLQATQRWLLEAEPQHYSLQILLISEEKTEELLKFLRKADVQPILERLYVYKMRGNKGQILWGVTYHEFNDAASASAAVATLPESVRRNQPFSRSVANLRERLAN
jgi:type II secretory pathway predicted ATPase ExeA